MFLSPTDWEWQEAVEAAQPAEAGLLEAGQHGALVPTEASKAEPVDDTGGVDKAPTEESKREEAAEGSHPRRHF